MANRIRVRQQFFYKAAYDTRTRKENSCLRCYFFRLLLDVSRASSALSHIFVRVFVCLVKAAVSVVNVQLHYGHLRCAHPSPYALTRFPRSDATHKTGAYHPTSIHARRSSALETA